MRLELESTTAPTSITLTPLTSNEARDTLQAGIKAAQSGDRAKARAALLRAVELDPRSETGWLWLASISEFPEELLGFLGNVLDINPDNKRALEWTAATKSLMARTFVQRGVDAAEENRADYAIECFYKALESDRRNAAAWLWLAKLSGSEDEKVRFLQEALDIDPENEEASALLGNARNAVNDRLLAAARGAAVRGDRKAALETIEQLLSSSPQCTEAWILKAHLVEGFGEKLSCFESILSYDPVNTAAASGRDSLMLFVEFAADEKEPNDGDQQLSSAGTSESAADLVSTSDSEKAFGIEALPVGDPDRQTSRRDGASEFTTGPLEVVSEEPIFDAAVYAYAEPAAEEANVAEVSFETVAATIVPDVTPDVTVPEFTVEDAVTLPERSLPASEDHFADHEPAVVSSCPFCSFANDARAFACGGCKAVLTLSDIDMLLSNRSVDRSIVTDAVARMENERSSRSLSENELTTLGIGHINLRNFDSGYACLYDATQVNPGNFVLERQVNSLLLRLEDIRQSDDHLPAPISNKTIVVVDDSPTVRKLIMGKLENCGHEVFCCNDGVDAIELLESVTPDLVLLDISMPRMDGYQVCKMIRSKPATKDIPVVMISGKDGFFDKVRGRMVGATGYITKPFGPETLMRSVELYLSGATVEAEN